MNENIEIYCGVLKRKRTSVKNISTDCHRSSVKQELL